MFDKEYIKSSTSSYIASIFIIKKSNEEFYIYIDYQTLNSLIVKNYNAFSLIKEILIKLCAAKIFNKFDIIIIFNEIRIKKRNKEKIIFLIRYNLFEYIIMLFELCNTLSTFQTFINEIL